MKRFQGTKKGYSLGKKTIDSLERTGMPGRKASKEISKPAGNSK